MPTIEEMKATLEGAGYVLREESESWAFDTKYMVYAPDGWEYEHSRYKGKEGLSISEKEGIEKAYAHYLQQQRHQQMEALLNEVAEIWSAPIVIGNIDLLNATFALQFAKFAEKAKAILAEKDVTNA